MLWGAFNNASTAMIAHSHALETISQNVANVNTTGYKAEQTLFKTVLSEGHAAPPTTVGLNIFGVQPVDRRFVTHQGMLQETGVWHDLAINGQGMFVLNTSADGSGDTFFSRDGAFYPQAIGDRNYLTTSQGYYLMGYANSDPSTSTTLPNSGEPTSAIYTMPQSTLVAVATTTATVTGNIPANATLPQNMFIPVYDSEGNTQSLRTQWTAAGDGTWSVDYDVNGTLTGTPTTVTFDGDGVMTSPTTPISATVTWGNGLTNTIALDFSQLTQFADTGLFLNTIVQDGRPTGELTSTYFNNDGELFGSYSNGQSVLLAKVPLAYFVAPDQLEALSGNLFQQSELAGDVEYLDINSAGTRSELVANSLETSNVALEDEFSRMIITQKAYSSNATVFKTADEMTMIARDLKA
jgi:flagellar hook protein FlgE